MINYKNKAINKIVKNFLKNSKKTFRFTIISMTIAVWGIIVITSIIGGFDNILVESIINFFPHVIVNGDVNLKDEVITSFKFNMDGGMVSFRGITDFVQYIEFDNEDFLKKSNITGSFEEGIVIGKDLANNLNISIGEELNFFIPRGLIPIMSKHRIGGIFESGIYNFDSNIILIKNTESDKRFTGLMIEDPYNPERFIKNYLQNRSAISWKESNQSLASALEVDSLIAFIVTFFIVLMSGFSISNSITFSILTRKREIGIIKSLGLKDKDLSKIFIKETLFISVFAFIFGLIFGLITIKILDLIKIPLPEGIFYLGYLPVKLRMSSIFIALILNTSISFLFSYFTTKRILKFDILEALRDDE